MRFLRPNNSLLSSCVKRMQSTTTSQVLELKPGRRIFVDHLEGKNESSSPCVLYVPGFLSHRLSEKGLRLHEYCSEVGHEFIRYDPEGFGNSAFEDPSKWKDVEFRHWFEDCEAAMSVSRSKKLILVGSSMGGWISLLAQKKYPDRIAGMVLIAPAQNFISRMVAEGTFLVEDPSIKSFVDVKSFAKKSEELSISLETNSNVINAPVRILHGMKDDVIPCRSSVDLIHSIKGQDVELTLIKEGDHVLNKSMGKIRGHLEVLIGKSALGMP